MSCAGNPRKRFGLLERRRYNFLWKPLCLGWRALQQSAQWIDFFHFIYLFIFNRRLSVVRKTVWLWNKHDTGRVRLKRSAVLPLPVAAPSCRWSRCLPRSPHSKKEEHTRSQTHPARPRYMHDSEGVFEAHLGLQWNRVERLVDLVDLSVLSGKTTVQLDSRNGATWKTRVCCSTGLTYLHVVLQTPGDVVNLRRTPSYAGSGW